MPGHRFSLRYGAIRRFGPARMAREQPWLNPEDALEELFYKGIIHRGYGTIGGYSGEIFEIPEQLFEKLPPPKTVVPQIDRVEVPRHVARDGDALIEDLFALLVRIRKESLPAPKRGGEGLSTPPALEMGSRFSGESVPERTDLLWRLLWRLGLIQAKDGIIQPGRRARRWLQLPGPARLHHTFLAWRDDRDWDELRLVPSLRCEDTGWQSDPVTARRNLLSMLGECPHSTWYSLDSFVRALKRYHPDYMRADGDFDSWYIRDAETNEYLTGYEAWDQIEGAVVRHIITSSLRWLGVVDIGRDGEGAPTSAFRITERGWALLVEDVKPSVPGTGPSVPGTGPSSSKQAAPPSPPAKIDADFNVKVPLENSLYERYQLERFAEWKSQDAQAAYRITAESIWQSQNAGIKIAQITRFLKRVSHGQVPATVLRTLQAWGGRFGRAFIRRTLLLQTVDERTMKQISDRPEIRPLLGEALSATACMVDEGHVEELIARLKALGVWPHCKI